MLQISFWRPLKRGTNYLFGSLPLAVRLRINKSARLHADFVDQAVRELVNSDRVCRVRKQPFIVNPLSLSTQPCGLSIYATLTGR